MNSPGGIDSLITTEQSATTAPRINRFYLESIAVILVFIIGLSFLPAQEPKGEQNVPFPVKPAERSVSTPITTQLEKDQNSVSLAPQASQYMHQGRQQSKAQSNQALIEQVYQEVFNKGSLVGTEHLFADTFYYYELGWPRYVRGLENLQLLADRHRNAFSDLHYRLDAITVDGDIVIVHWVASGTLSEDMGTVSVTGMIVTWGGTTVWRIMGGKVFEAWTIWGS